MTAPKKLTLRRVATFFAAAGMLVTSSGVALMVAAAPANAKTPVGICHATSSDSNPYVYIVVDDDSVKYQGHLAHKTDPNKTWKNAGTFNGVPHAAGAAKPDIIGVPSAASCVDAGAPSNEAVADVDFLDADCANPTRADYDTTGAFVVLPFAVQSGTVAPGQHVVIRATALPGSTFDGGGTTKDFEHTFAAAVDPNAPPCVVVNPPGVASATVNFVDPTCDNLNDASYTTNGDNVSFSVTSGSAAPGEDIVVTATADPGNEFDGGATTKDFPHTFGAAVDLLGEPCVDNPAGPVTPPIDVPIATPTVVHSGLVSTEDLRGEQGLALLVTGMVMMVLAGGLGLGATRKARI